MDLEQAARALLPCPFCGGEAMFSVEQRENHPDYGGHSAMCGTCGAGIGYIFACGDDPLPLLREQWNKRTALRAALAAEAGRVSVPFDQSSKSATLYITLRADSGYESTEQHRITPGLWANLCAMLAAAQEGS